MIKHYLVNGTDRYTMRIDEQKDGSFKLFALSHPPDPFGKGPSSHHRYSSGEICITAGKEPRTLEGAKATAMSWCHQFSEYIRTGVFPNKAQKIDV